MIYKFNFSVSGDNFYPEKIINDIQGNFIINFCFKPTDKTVVNGCEEFGYGGMSFWHPKKFSTEDRIIEYETTFVNFIEDNYNKFVANGAEDLEIFVEIYFDGIQCNFEVFNKELLGKLAKLGVSIPISIYVLSCEEVQKWENEIMAEWESN